MFMTGRVRKPLIGISLHLTHKMTDWAFGEQFVAMLCDLGPQLAPERVGVMERRTAPFVDVQQCEEIWAGVNKVEPAEGPLSFIMTILSGRAGRK